MARNIVAGNCGWLESMITSLEETISSSSQGDQEIIMDSPCGDELDLVIINDDEMESLLTSLFPRENDKRDSNGFTFAAIMKHISNCAKRHKRTKADMRRDILKMVAIGLARGNIRTDQLQRTAHRGAERIRKLAYWYNIPIRSAGGGRIRLQSDTLTFVRAISCFPHLASLILYKKDGFAKNGAQSVLGSEQLPDAMKHSGFSGLIPKGCDPYLMKAYVFAHTAYMVDFSKLINPGDGRSLKAIISSQLNYSKVGVEKSPYLDKFKAGFLKTVGLTDPVVFKKILDVCNNLCKEVGNPELAFETAEKDHIKDNMICFVEDDSKNVGDGELAKKLADELSIASIHDPSTSTD